MIDIPRCAHCGTTKPTLYRDRGLWLCLDPERCTTDHPDRKDPHADRR